MDPAAAEYVRMSSRMRAVRETEDKGDSEIQQLFRGAVLFITGGTGFLGKQLVEKLLRACRGIKKMYLLSRSKKGISMEERLTKTLKDPVFDQLWKINPEFDKCIVPIEGDITQLRLGIKVEDWKTITEQVNFIYHQAATVLFTEPIKKAVNTNVRATREALILARECRNLKGMVYVSTAFSHCNRKEVAEKFYPSPVPPETIIEMVNNMEEKRLDAMTPALTESWPNTYTFSKAIAEEMVRVMGDGLPISIVRPGIVVPSHREPAPGWLDISNVFGPSGIVLGTGIGAIRTVLADDKCLVDVVPVDYVNNLTIAASWETAQRYHRGEQDIKIYTCSRSRNRISWGDCRQNFDNDGRSYYSSKTIWYPAVSCTPNKKIYLFLTTLLHFIPAFFIDGISKAMGKKIRISRVYQKAHQLNTVLSYFLLNTWDFLDENTLDLSKKLSPADKTIFHFDVADIEHKPLMIIWWLGLRKYIIKDGLQGTNKTLKRMPFFRMTHYAVSALYFFFLWKILSSTFALIFFSVAFVLQCSGYIEKGIL